MLDTASTVLAPSGTGTGAHWAASGWNTPRAAQWADSRAAWREGMELTLTLRLRAVRSSEMMLGIPATKAR